MHHHTTARHALALGNALLFPENKPTSTLCTHLNISTLEPYSLTRSTRLLARSHQ